jgi:hypothetical protein
LLSKETSRSTEPLRKADINIKLSEFEIPPMQDIMLVGKKAPIGPEAVRQMVDAVSPDQYEIVRLNDHEVFEAVVLKKSLLKLLPKEKLLSVVIEEGNRIANENMVVKAQINITIQVSRTVDL